MLLRRLAGWQRMRGHAIAVALFAFSFAPGHAAGIVPLSAFGALGDGKADDTAALQMALLASPKACLDGQGREYRVSGTLRAAADLCLLNVRIRQDTRTFDTRPFIAGQCAVVADPNTLIDCGDPTFVSSMPAGLAPYLFTRTLLVRPEEGQPRIKVVMRNVRIDRGNDPASGARSEAAGLWIQWADKVELDNVEITGGGKGFGLMIAHASNITARNVHLHDLVWAPYAGDAPLLIANVRSQGWNTAPIREFRTAGQQGAAVDGFHGMRVQEQLTCLMIVSSDKVVFEGLRVERCLARFVDGDLPWQADGVGIGQASANIRIADASRISDTWEGIDVVGGGGGVRNVAVLDTQVTNSFSYGIKLGYDLAGVVIDNVRIRGAGLAGVVLYGSVRNAVVRRTSIEEVGTVMLDKAATSPWRQERAGVLIEPRDTSVANDYPNSVVLDRVRIAGGPHCRSGVTNLTPVRERTLQVTVSSCESSRIDRPPVRGGQ